ncbi:hypothetical protein MKW98_003697 [Papaver atlanticum]|uniref:Cytochrome P450 n=1 Tax=Papaver atlanticum TaxID=357466 RepID=A0AAD4SII7_9MAGN|nr:hypothetical protein MKW98_003697 [Papaver atlanticum]
MKTSIYTNEMFVSAVICLAAALLLHRIYRGRTKTYSIPLPPGPPGWPVVGNLFDLGRKPQETFVELQQKYGPVFMLRLGSRNTLVIASADAATELFKNHDHSFRNRHQNEVISMGEDYAMPTGTRSYGPYWRMMRRLYATKFFSHATIKNTAIKRRRCVEQLIQWISEEEKANRIVELRHFVFVSFFNLMGDLLFSRSLLDLQSGTGDEFYRFIEDMIQISVKPNAADFFPFLRKLDPQNLQKKMRTAMDGAVNIIDVFVKERRTVEFSHDKHLEKDFWNVLMELEGNGKDEPKTLSDRQINLLILEMFMGSTETTTSTIEWAMTELLLNPKVMRKIKAEIAQVIGHDRKIEESDIENLPYLAAVLKETMRLHPSIPLLIPRTNSEDTEFMGYMIPKDTQVLVNVWGIGRDPASWNNPLLFNPDRYLGTNIDYRGQYFELMPFGGGRRICPGIPMAHQVLHLVLGSLIQCFDWTLEAGVTPETIDMGETLGMTLKKFIPLKVTPRASAIGGQHGGE